jgi:O-methyltransferase involved in polyketide biosynthesis
MRDPFAARLAGDRGTAILRELPHSIVLRFGLAIRTRFGDELLLEALAAHRITTVPSVGCGLDARPWRLDLPPDLRWIEIDFAGILDYKDGLMSGETLRCRRERMVADVNDPAQRRAIYEAAGSAPALMITERLLPYLPAATVDALAGESRRRSSVAHWIADFTTSAFNKAIGGDQTMQSVRHVQAPDSLKGEEVREVIQRNGWMSAARRSCITDCGFAMERVRRMTGGATPPPMAVSPDDPTGVHRFTGG